MKRLVSNIIKKNQNIIIEKLLNCNEKIIFIKSIPLTGKTTLLKELYDSYSCENKVFISGCDPKKMNYINKSIISEIDLIINSNNYTSIFCDEYYNLELLNYLDSINSNKVKVYITTNIDDKIMDKYKIIDIYPDIFNNLNTKVKEKMGLDLSEKIKKCKLNLVELNLICKEYNEKEIKKQLIIKDRSRTLPTSTFFLYVNNNYSMLKNFDFDV